MVPGSKGTMEHLNTEKEASMQKAQEQRLTENKYFLDLHILQVRKKVLEGLNCLPSITSDKK